MINSTLTIIKISGNVIDDPLALEDFLKQANRIQGPKIIVHGGGAIASEMSAKMGIPIKMHEGRRITDAETLKLVTMLYAGLINKQIVAKLQYYGTNALGLSGADGNTVPATKRAPSPIDFGFVGDVDPKRININLLNSLLGQGICPVFCALTHDENGSMLNTNADTMASSIAVAMSKTWATRLIYCFEKDGVLSNPEDPSSVIFLLTKDYYQTLKKEGAVNKGMIPKLDNSFTAIENGVFEVLIKNAKNLDNDYGTTIR